MSKKMNIMSFDDFVKGGDMSDPKKALDVEPGDKIQKEKSIDLVKRADLSKGIKASEPDYTKTKKEPIQEGLVEDAQIQMDAIDTQIAALDKQYVNKSDQNYVAQKSKLDLQKKQISDKLAQDQESAAKANTSTPAAPTVS